MTAPLFHVDAFTSEPFRGNPAAVCLLDGPRPADWMQKVAAEMNLSETAFLHPVTGGFALRWFTPAVEVPLCGHATLASAHVLYETARIGKSEEARFHTLSGVLTARRSDRRIELDFPAMTLTSTTLEREVLEAVGVAPSGIWRSQDRGKGDYDVLLLLRSEEEVRAARPDFPRLNRALRAGVIVTAAASGGHDFVSRFFAPAWGIDEDPVTGAAHCSLAPFWTARLGRSELAGYQASARGGTVHVRVEGDRVALGGQAVTVTAGTLEV